MHAAIEGLCNKTWANKLSWVGSTVHAVNSNRVHVLGKVRLDWFAISLNLGIGFLRVKSAHLYKDGIVSLLIKQ